MFSAGILATAALSGCAAPAPRPVPTTSPAALPAGVSVEVLQYRSDYGPRILQVSVTNGSDAPLTVTRAAFSSPHFTADAEWARTTEFDPGETTDLRVQLAETDCSSAAPDEAGTDDAGTDDAGSAGDDGADTVSLDFVLADGSSGTAALVPTDPFGAIANVVAQDCAAETTARVVDIALGASLTTVQRDGHPVALLDVTMTPTGREGAVTVSTIDSTILVKRDGGGDWAVGERFTADSDPYSLTLDFVPNNCRLHSVAEDKRGTYFPVGIETGAGDATFFLPASTAVKEEIYAYIAEYCGWE